MPVTYESFLHLFLPALFLFSAIYELRNAYKYRAFGFLPFEIAKIEYEKYPKLFYVFVVLSVLVAVVSLFFILLFLVTVF